MPVRQTSPTATRFRPFRSRAPALSLISPARLDVRTRQELMGRFGAAGGPRSRQVAGQYVDILGEIETLSKTPFYELYGSVRLVSLEDLLVERVLISV